MLRLISRILTSLSLIVALSVFSTPYAGQHVWLPVLIQAAQADVSLAQAVKRVKQKTGGRVLSARELNTSGGKTYLIKVLLPSGQVKTFRVRAVDGSMN